jgi:signal transduction histidine kinase
MAHTSIAAKPAGVSVRIVNHFDVPRSRLAGAHRRDEQPPRTVDALRGELGRTDLARHLAFFYRSPQTQLEVATAFVEHGLRTHNRCLYFADTNSRDTVERALRSAGIDVDARMEAGDLRIERAQNAYRAAEFDPDRLITHLAESSRESVADGYEGLWLAGELSWCFHTELDYDHVVDFEADFESASLDLPVTALCQYDLNRFDDESVAKALWTHEQVIYRYTLCENPYYIPPAEYRSGTDRPPNAGLMLEQMHALAHTRTQVERREQRLAVVNRILRHNIRNDLNVVRGILSQLDDGDLIRTAVDHVDDIVEIADKARHVERTISHSTVRRTELEPFVAEAVARVERSHPEAHVAVAGDTDTPAVTDTNLDTALTELLEYAIRQQNGEPSVSLTVSDRPGERVRIDVRYPGGPVSPNDRRVLDRGSETPLEHCRGLGLWLVKWIVENAYGRLEFPENGDPQMRLELYRCLD